MKKISIIGAVLLIPIVLFSSVATAADGNPWDRVWSAISDLRNQIAGIPAGPAGPQGAPGTDGTDGSNGLDGKTILNGTSNPTASIGVVGDFYLNTTTATIFGPKTADGWNGGINLIGPQGPAGSSRMNRYIAVGSTSVEPSTVGQAIAACSAGDQVLSGGFAGGRNNLIIAQSRPALIVSEAWLVDAVNNSINPQSLTAYAWCNDLTP